MDLRLIARDGIFSTSEAERLGIDRHALTRLCRSGEVARLTRGWYAVVASDVPDRTELHRLTALALGRQFRARAVISHHSLLLLRRLPTFRPDLGVVHLTSAVDDGPGADAGGRTGARRTVTVRRPGLVIHRPVGALRLSTPGPDGDRPATMPLAHAVVQAGLLGGPVSALVPADAAMRAGSVTPATLAAAVADLRHHTGIGPVRVALTGADARHESPGETRTAYVLRRLGFEVEPQLEVVAEGRLFRADFRIKGTRVLVEFDGAVKYADGRRSTLFEEKRREDALRREGWVVVRLVWADLEDPQRVRRLVLDAVARAA
ncbi:type IV toxin-antitoxin system AbiEi family antitoxin domain-containing protein [Terrabacter terrae]|uniref:Type IV toxin-antitoxin system AbiEi family antitoxin domain-containing protein n=1 Tax=Terrabacter terrae TaxID=318434 RepID=A0ABN2UII4_9MICO